MKKAIYIKNLPLEEDTPSKSNPRVSAISFFNDEIWDFTTEQADPSLSSSMKIVRWDRYREGITNHEDYAEMFNAMKVAALALLQSGRKPLTICSRVDAWYRFVKFLVNHELPFFRFQDVPHYVTEEYIEQMKNRPGHGKNEKVSKSTVAFNVSCLNMLYDFKRYMPDYLMNRPSGFKSPNLLAGFTVNEALDSRTLAIPDADLKILIDWALDFVLNKSAGILKCLDELSTHIKEYTSDSTDIKLSYQKVLDFWKPRSDYNNIFTLLSDLCKLRTACYIIIAFSTGMRISEILSIRKGCITEQKTQNHGNLLWIDPEKQIPPAQNTNLFSLNSILYKTQKNPRGVPRSWMCGEKAAQAVKVLETMVSYFTVEEKPYLFIPVGSDGMRTITINKTKTGVISRTQMSNCFVSLTSELKLEINLASHQLRRSFARNIIRWSATSILALQRHFKHWSILMTDWYVGLDPELMEDLEAERIILSIELTEKICSEPIGGVGGRKFKLELDRRIKDGTIPKQFLGKAGNEFKMNMIQSMHDSGMVVFPCSTMNFCVFQKDQAECTKGDAPITSQCQPFSCSNSYILPENVPAVKTQLARTIETYKRLSEEEKASPMGNFIKTEITKIERSIEPLVQ